MLLVPVCVIGQEYDSPFGKGKINKNVCLRGELGWNKSWFTSLGVSYVYSNVNSHVPLTLVAYTSAEVNLAPYNSGKTFYAYKAGFETGNLLLAVGAELRNNTDFSGNNHLIFMPKAGLTFYGHANLFYGYNVFRTENNIFGIGHNQLSLSVSISRKVFKEPLVPGNSNEKAAP